MRLISTIIHVCPIENNVTQLMQLNNILSKTTSFTQGVVLL